MERWVVTPGRAASARASSPGGEDGERAARGGSAPSSLSAPSSRLRSVVIHSDGGESVSRMLPGRLQSWREQLGESSAAASPSWSWSWSWSASPNSDSRASFSTSNAGTDAGTDAASRPPTTTSSGSPFAATTKVKKKRIRIKTERRREQCRINQARYRNKQRSCAAELENTVEQLRQDVRRLSEQRRTLNHTVNTRDAASKVVVEYCRLFRFGLNIVGATHAPEAGPPRQRRLPPLEQQLAYVESCYHENLRIDDLDGRDNFLEQTRRFSVLYDDVGTTLSRLEVVTCPDSCVSIYASIRADMTVSSTTIRHVFPHLEKTEYDHVRWKLLGQQLACASIGVFVFDANGRVVRVDWTIDFVSTLQRVLSIKETAVVLQQAQIVRDAYLVESGDPEEVETYGDDDADYGDQEETKWSETWEGTQRPTANSYETPRQHAASRQRVYHADYQDNAGMRDGSEREEREDDSEDGVLIHDGQGDDFVMV